MNLTRDAYVIGLDAKADLMAANLDASDEAIEVWQAIHNRVA
jgi:hypothetical protein